MRDQFSAIFGERRGRLCDEEDEKEVFVPDPGPPAKTPFSSRRKVARRRMHLAQHLLIETGWMTVTAINKELSAIYVTEDPALRADLASLVAQRVCLRTGSPKPTQGNLLRYRVLPFETWFQAHQDTFLAWKDNGKP